MTAKRYRVDLYSKRLFGRKRTDETNLDITDVKMLRETLERLVKEHKGTLRLDLSEWFLRVHLPGSGRRVARVLIDPAGRTVVKRP